MYPSIAEKVERILKRKLPGAKIKIKDPLSTGLFLEAVVISKAFQGKSILEQHRMVMEPLTPLFESGLYSLQLKTRIR